jgi:hypothetical protein
MWVKRFTALAILLAAQPALAQISPGAPPATGAIPSTLPPATPVPVATTPAAPPTATTPTATLTSPPSAITPTTTNPPTAAGNGQWRTPGARNPADLGTTATTPASGATEPLQPLDNAPRRPLANVSQGPVSLPNEQGQVWREYDITPYTVRVTSTNRPEQAIVDWILRETGYEAWHSEPLGVLSANRRSLKVYHTPQMHAVVSELVDRFVSSEAESQAFGMRVVTIGNPNWRAKVHSKLTPIPVQTQGIQAWLVYKEDAAWMLAELRKRTDFREHSSPHLLVNNGQSATVSATRPRSYVRDAVLQPNAWPAFTPDTAQFDEGFSLEFNPLLALDSRTVDAVLKCNIDQLEKLVPVALDIPSQVASRQRTRIEVPQATHCRLQERFRWPVDRVLVVGLGVAPPPVPTDPHPLLAGIPGLNAAPRADLLVFIECKGKVTAAPTAAASPLNAMRDSRAALAR